MSITIAAMLLGIFGVWAVIAFILTLIVWRYEGEWGQFQMFSFVNMIAGLLFLTAANGLRQLNKYSGIMGIILGVIGFFIINFIIIDPSLLVLFSLLCAIVVLLIGLGWKSLS